MMSSITIRAYQGKDKEAVLHLMDANTPKYFHPNERNDLIHYLDHELEDYFVVLWHEQIIGAGGLNYTLEKKRATISWGMISPDFQGRGIGKMLTEYRIQYAHEKVEVELIEVRTTQLTYEFYQKLNFKLIKTEKDFWGEGFDLYHLEQRKRKG